MLAAFGWGLAAPANILVAATAGPDNAIEQATSSQADDEFEGLPAGKGQELTFNTCQACHSIKLVLQQGLSRDSWNETLAYMVNEQEMEPLPPADKKIILDYLSTYLGTDHRPQK